MSSSIRTAATARMRAEVPEVSAADATTFDISLTPLPVLQHLTADQRQAECRRIVGEIQDKAESENKEKGRQPMGVAAILAQDPHAKPTSTDRSPAPFVHATDDSTEMEFRVRYRAFVDAFRAEALRLLRSSPRNQGHVPTLGLSTAAALQRNGLNRAGHHAADEAAA